MAALCYQAGFAEDGRIKGLREMMVADAAATVVGTSGSREAKSPQRTWHTTPPTARPIPPSASTHAGSGLSANRGGAAGTLTHRVLASHPTPPTCMTFEAGDGKTRPGGSLEMYPEHTRDLQRPPRYLRAGAGAKNYPPAQARGDPFGNKPSTGLPPPPFCTPLGTPPPAPHPAESVQPPQSRNGGCNHRG